MADLTLLLVGFFHRQSLYRGRGVHNLDQRAKWAQDLYYEIYCQESLRLYYALARHFDVWAFGLCLLAEDFRRKSLQKFM